MVEGNLTAKPELKTAANGNPYVNISLGVNSSYKDKDGNWQKEVSFVDAQAFGKLASAIAEKGEQGKAVRLVGKLKQQRWMDKDGQQRSKIVISADTADLNPNINGSVPNQLNQTVIEGNIVASPDTKTFANGGALSSFSIAVDDDYKDKDGNWQKNPSFIDVETWGEGRAKFLQEKAEKGKAVRIVGRLKQNRWEDAEGKKHSRLVLVADDIKLKTKEKAVEKQQPQKNVETGREM